MTDRPTLLSVKQLCSKHEHAVEGGIRGLIFNRKTNGFGKCILRVGRKILIDEDKYFKWLEEQNQK